MAPDGGVTDTGFPHALNATVLVMLPPDVSVLDAYSSGAYDVVSIARVAVDSGSDGITVPAISVVVLSPTLTEIEEVGAIGTKTS
jgi:hypothetical protein